MYEQLIDLAEWGTSEPTLYRCYRIYFESSLPHAPFLSLSNINEFPFLSSVAFPLFI
jgi:hypothetical protein